MLAVEMSTADIPNIYRRFAKVIGDSIWKRRTAVLRAEVRGSPLLGDHVFNENSIVIALEACRQVCEQYGQIPLHLVNDKSLHPAMAFAAQVLSAIDGSGNVEGQRFKQRVAGALEDPDALRALRVELAVASHLLRRKQRVVWPDESGVSGRGIFDLLAPDLGPKGLEFECKSISGDTGRKVRRRDALNFYNVLLPNLKEKFESLSCGLAVVVTVPARLPRNNETQVELATAIVRQVLIGISGQLSDGTHIQVSQFDSAVLRKYARIAPHRRKALTRPIVEALTRTENRESATLPTRGGGALVVVVQSIDSDSVLDETFSKLRKASKRQLSGDRAGVLAVEFHDLDGQELFATATQDHDPSQPPTALALAVSRFLASDTRPHVVGVAFLSEGAIDPEYAGAPDLGRTAYQFPKRESAYWSDDFEKVFATMA